MAGLRWILLGAGIAPILGLWWWETRKSRTQPQVETAGRWTGGSDISRDESDGDAHAEGVEGAEADAAYPPTIERVRVPRRPPLIEIPEDLEVDVSDFVGIDRRRGGGPEFELEPVEGPDAEAEAAANDEGVYAE